MRHLYILDDLFRRIHIFDLYESLIWTERFNALGDFELSIASTFDNRMKFKHGTYLGIDDSKRVMIVETVEDKVSSEGQQSLLIKGVSLESALDDRPLLDPLGEQFKWGMTGTPMEIAEKMFQDICIDGIVDEGDKLPLYKSGNLFPADTVPVSQDPVSVEVDPGSLYRHLQEFCSQFNFGIRLYRNQDQGELYFNIYSGVDRTSTQTSNSAVVFAPDLDNLQNTTELSSSALVKNVALVVSPQGSKYVYAPNADPTKAGFERKVVTIWASDIPEGASPMELDLLLEQKGREVLSEHRSFIGFDGEINQFNNYMYGRDYNLGDIVEMRNANGFTNNMRVTEQIFVSDGQGDKSYPTLSLNLFISVGTWLSWEQNKTWSEQGPDTWGSLP